MMELYAIRHGQSESNLAGRFCGWGQVPLTEKGMDDARRAGEHLRNLTFEKVYASDLLRAVQTCQAALPGIPFEQDPLLRELNVGTLSGLTPDQALDIHGEPLRLARQQRDFTAYGGENHAMQHQRAVQFLKKLEANPVEGRVAAFCHEGTVKCMLNAVLQTPFAPINRYVADNGSIAVFIWDGAWRLKCWNIV